MSDSQKVVRTMLTDENVVFLNELLTLISYKGKGPEFYKECSFLLRVASDMLALASDLHASDVQVPWNSACWAARLAPKLSEVDRTADSMALILGPLHIDVIKPAPDGVWRAKYPMLRVAKKD